MSLRILHAYRGHPVPALKHMVNLTVTKHMVTTSKSVVIAKLNQGPTVIYMQDIIPKSPKTISHLHNKPLGPFHNAHAPTTAIPKHGSRGGKSCRSQAGLSEAHAHRYGASGNSSCTSCCWNRETDVEACSSPGAAWKNASYLAGRSATMGQR